MTPTINKHNDLPREELLARAQKAMDECAAANPEVHFKFTCQHCGERCTLCDANKLWKYGECHVCGKETKIDKGGFMLQMNLGL
jgi:hypothetical protein